MQHVFVAGDPQGFGHGVCVKGRIQSHHCSMNPFTLKIICKLLLRLLMSDAERNSSLVFSLVICVCILSAMVRLYLNLNIRT